MLQHHLRETVLIWWQSACLAATLALSCSLQVLALQMTSTQHPCTLPVNDGPLPVPHLRQRDVLRGAQVQRMVVLPGQHQQLNSLGQLPVLQEEFSCMGSMRAVQLHTRWGLARQSLVTRIFPQEQHCILMALPTQMHGPLVCKVHGPQDSQMMVELTAALQQGIINCSYKLVVVLFKHPCAASP